MDNDYYLKKINLSLEKIERHLAEIAGACIRLQNRTTDQEDRNNKKEGEE